MKKHYRIKWHNEVEGVLSLDKWGWLGWMPIKSVTLSWIFRPGVAVLSDAEREAIAIEELKAAARKDAAKNPKLGEVICKFSL